MKLKFPLFQAALSLALVLSFSQNSIGNNNKETLAKIGSKTLTLEEFNRKFNEVGSQTINPPTKKEFLEDLIRYYVGLQEAEKKGLRNDPLVKERMDQELYKGLLERALGPDVAAIKVTEEQMKAWYKSNPEIRTSHILFEFKPGSKPEEIAAARKRAQEVYEKEIKNSKRPFEELVRLYSDDPLSKQTGGDIGWQNRLTLAPSYYEAALKMKTGEVRGLIETPFGFHVVKLTGRHSYENANKRQIRTAVFDEIRKQKFDQYFEKLKKNYSIQTNTKLLQ